MAVLKDFSAVVGSARSVGSAVILASAQLANVEYALPGAFSPTNATLIAWRAAVQAAGHPDPSGDWLRHTDALLNTLEASGALAEIDGLALAGEAATHCVRDIIDPTRVGALINAPTYTARAGVTTNGTTQYVDTGFNPSSHFSAASNTAFCFGVYERTNVATTSWHGVWGGDEGAILLSPRRAGGTIEGYTNSAAYTFSVADSLGLSVVVRDGSGVAAWKNGAQVGTSSPTVHSSAMLDASIYLGGYNNTAGGAAGFRATQVAAWIVASAAIDQAVLASAMETYMDALGVGVVA